MSLGKRKNDKSFSFWRLALIAILTALIIWLLIVIEGNIDAVTTAAPANPNAIFDALFDLVIDYRYLALFLTIFVSAIGVPLPGGAVAVTAFVLAGDGFLSAPLVAVVALSANLAGDLVGFGLVRRFGPPLVKRLRLTNAITSSVATRFTARLERRPAVALFISRLTTSLSPLANLVAGLSRVNWRKFIIPVVIGQGAEVVVNYGYAQLFGDNWPYVSKITGEVGGVVLALTAIAIVIIWRRRSMDKEPEIR